MKIVIRTVNGSPERAHNVAKMCEVLGEATVFVDGKRDSYASFRRGCEEVKGTGGLILEDDVQLCKDFLPRVHAVIREVGRDQVINFFEKPRIWLPAGFERGSSFLWMQCLYLPAGFAGRIYDYYDEFKTKRPQSWQGMATDCLVSYALVKEKRRYYRHRPCLVQHLPFQSVIGPRPTNRQTPYFVDDLDAQGVNYDDLKPAK